MSIQNTLRERNRARVELKPRHRSKQERWNPGGVIRGDREIWIDGAHWLNATMSSHGVHGARHTLSYADGGELLVDPEAKRPRSVEVESRKWRQRHAAHGVIVPDQYEAIVDKVLELLDAGKLEDPATRKARGEERAAAYRAQCDAETAERERMLEGVFSLRDSPNLTQQERDGLAFLYKEAFAAPMPFPEGRIVPKHYRCCDQARFWNHSCVCACATECPVHGVSHYGTHD